MKKRLFPILAALFLSTCGGSSSPDVFNELSAVPARSVSVKSSTSILVDGKETLYPIFDPLNATDRALIWSSDSETVATVDNNGTVTGVSVGETTIRVRSKNGKYSSSCTVTVSPIPIAVTGVTLMASAHTLIVSEMWHDYPSIVPPNATNQNLIWSSSNPAVATVSDGGVVTAVTATLPNTTVITVTTVDGGFSAQCTVTVEQPPISISYNGNLHTSDTIADVNLNAGVPFTVSGSPTPDSGYIFCGWNTAIDGSGDAYDAGQTITRIANTTLYAQWLGCSGTTITSVPPGMTNVVIPNTVTTIQNTAFQGNTSIVSVSIPVSVISIGDQPFINCSNLTTITSESSQYRMIRGGLVDTTTHTLMCVPAKYNGAFTVDSSISAIAGYALSECGQISTITFESPSGMTTLSENAFSDLTAVNRIVLPEGMTSVGDLAFYNCGASRIDFPSSMITVGTSTTNGAFGSNPNLTMLYFNATSPITTFIGPSTGPWILNSGTVNVYVPVSVVTAYQGSNWFTVYNLTILQQ